MFKEVSDYMASLYDMVRVICESQYEFIDDCLAAADQHLAEIEAKHRRSQFRVVT